MTTFEFKMTPRAYYAGWRVLQRQQLRMQWVFCALCAVLAVAGILLYFLLQDVAETAILPALSGIVAAMAVLLPWVRRSSVLREFGNSPTLTPVVYFDHFAPPKAGAFSCRALSSAFRSAGSQSAFSITNSPIR